MDTYKWILENEPISDYMNIYQKAKDDFLYKKIQSNMTIAFELKKLSPIHNQIYDERQALREEQAQRLGTLWLWLTVSPHDKVQFTDFQKKVTQFSQRKMFKDFFYVYEQRGKNKEEIGKGFHCHFLLKRDIKYKQNKIISNSKNSFKNMTNINDFNIFNFHWCPEEYLKDKIEYMTGSKTGCEKDTKQLIDVLFRQKYNLNIYYNKDDVTGTQATTPNSAQTASTTATTKEENSE